MSKVLTTRKRAYTVIGVYLDTHQRYADTFRAESPWDAEQMAQAQAEQDGCGLIIAGVVDGDVELAS